MTIRGMRIRKRLTNRALNRTTTIVRRRLRERGFKEHIVNMEGYGKLKIFAISKDNKYILNRDENPNAMKTLVIDVGSVNKIPYVVKVPVSKLEFVKTLETPIKKTHHISNPPLKLAKESEELSKVMRNRYPVVPKQAITLDKKSGSGVVLSQRFPGEGKFFSPIDKFPFSMLNNGDTLEIEYQGYLKKLQKTEKRGELAIGVKHGKEAFPHMIFVEWDPNTRVGRLVVEDLDHVFVHQGVRKI